MKKSKFNYLSISLFVLILVSFLIIEPSNYLVTLIFGVIGGSPYLINIFRKDFIKKNNLRTPLDAFYFSSSFLFLGYFFSFINPNNNPVSSFSNGEILIILLIIFIILIAASANFLAIKISVKSIALVNNISENGKVPMKDFLDIANKKKANILAVAGNLNGLKTDRGIILLKEFLKANLINKMELFVPEDSLENLKIIKKKFNDDELSKRVIINTVIPFVFLQGIVFAGEYVQSTDYTFTRGYYLYKPILSKDEIVDEKGIFVDIAEVDENNDNCKAINAFYNHLNGKNFKINDELKFVPGILTKKNRKFNHIDSTLSLFDVI